MYLAHIMLKTHQCKNGKKQIILWKGGKGPSQLAGCVWNFLKNKMLCPILSKK
jgi:hypothetical protein